jgi:hypothetical protein
MTPLTDRGMLWRTFPVIPRKRVNFDPELPVEFTLFNRSDVVFKCQGGYFTHNSYNLLDLFSSYWREICAREWMRAFGETYPVSFKPQQIEQLNRFSPIFSLSMEELQELKRNPLLFAPNFQDYALIQEISDRHMREHPSLSRLSSKELHEVIERTAECMIKTIYPIRILDNAHRKGRFRWFYLSNLEEKDPWGNLFSYRLVEEKRGSDGRVNEKVYRFSFATLFGILMIHNTICGASRIVSPKIYKMSPDAQLLYRYLIIAGSRIPKNRVEYIGHRLGWREKQRRRLSLALEAHFQELKESGLITGFEMTADKRGDYFLTLDLKKRKRPWNPSGRRWKKRIGFNPYAIRPNPKRIGPNPETLP